MARTKQTAKRGQGGGKLATFLPGATGPAPGRFGPAPALGRKASRGWAPVR